MNEVIKHIRTICVVLVVTFGIPAHVIPGMRLWCYLRTERP